MRKAEADLAGARLTAAAQPPLRDLLCFHCQPAAEKYLKAGLQEAGIPAPHIHDLVRLFDLLLLTDPSFRSPRSGMKSLSRYAVDYRYPGANATARQAASALRLAERVRRAMRQRLGLP